MWRSELEVIDVIEITSWQLKNQYIVTT